MIIVKIWGGVGNQLFQYSFGKSVSSRLNTELRFDIKTASNIKNFTNRKIGLTDFNVELNLASDSEIKLLKYFTSGYLSRIERKLIQKFPLFNINYRVEASSNKRLELSTLKDNCYYDGYWQSEYYFDTISDAIRKELILLKIPDEIAFLTLQNIESTNSISLHVRRSDYLTIKENSSRLGVCGEDYYMRAITYITQIIKDPVFYIFSDDTKWASKKFCESNYKIITDNSPSTDLFLMSNCKHNIIANSTFSWWGAWLNQKSEKTVIAPKNWYKGKLNDSTIDLIPPTWIRL